MFTGLVENLGVIVGRTSTGTAGKIMIRPDRALENPVHGESIAVNGCCLTLESVDARGTLSCHTLEETLRVTNLGRLPVGAKVNLERALRLGDRLGGHLVAGHVDAVAPVLGLGRTGGDLELKIKTPPELLAFLLPKGSIAVDGVSLTLLEVNADFFTVRLIPVTLTDTALSCRKSGDPVNLESDLIGKYVFRQLGLAQSAGSGAEISMDTLREAGFL
jgi:riboflavin synthase